MPSHNRRTANNSSTSQGVGRSGTCSYRTMGWSKVQLFSPCRLQYHTSGTLALKQPLKDETGWVRFSPQWCPPEFNTDILLKGKYIHTPPVWPDTPLDSGGTVDLCIFIGIRFYLQVNFTQSGITVLSVFCI